MIDAGLKLSYEAAQAELDEIVAEFTSNDEFHFDRLLRRVPAAALDGHNPSILIASGVAAYHDTIHDSFQGYEDGLEALKRLRAKGFALGVISQGRTVKQAEKVVRLRILPYLDRRALFFSDQIGMCKSSPKYYLKAAESLGVPPGECMHIGDRPDRDIDSANKAGWITVLNRRSGRYHDRAGATPPAHTIENFWDLLELIEKGYQPKPKP
jgi:putative hydrolase of the HAD superfamily